MNEQRRDDGAQQVLRSEWQRFVPTEITFIFRKFEGYIPNGIGSRSVPVGRQAAGWQAGRLADENVISFEIFKIL